MIKTKKLITAIKESVSAERDQYGWVKVDAEQEITAKTKVKEFVETGIGIIGDPEDTEESMTSEYTFSFEEEAGVVVE